MSLISLAMLSSAAAEDILVVSYTTTDFPIMIGAGVTVERPKRPPRRHL